MAFSIRSPAFAPGASIPARYTCDGENVSPPLEWGDVPPEAESLALIVDDPDAPLLTWVHWLVYDMPADRTALPENIPPQEVLDDGTRQGTTSFRRIGYGGPLSSGPETPPLLLPAVCPGRRAGPPSGGEEKSPDRGPAEPPAGHGGDHGCLCPKIA